MMLGAATGDYDGLEGERGGGTRARERVDQRAGGGSRALHPHSRLLDGHPPRPR